ncbi:MAG TPA: hypothetical protein VN226_02550 [Anaerolineales bacterium]|nr:hypothetical protein [Anaerolineales bacterium]
MFIGTEIAKIDKNNRITLPIEFMDPSGADLILTSGFEKNLMLFPINTFVALLSKLNSMNILDPEVRHLHRLLVGKAIKARISDMDQIQLPLDAISRINITDSAVLVGQGSYIEIWSVDQWTIEQKKVENFSITSDQIDLSI